MFLAQVIRGLTNKIYLPILSLRQASSCICQNPGNQARPPAPHWEVQQSFLPLSGILSVGCTHALDLHLPLTPMYDLRCPFTAGWGQEEVAPAINARAETPEVQRQMTVYGQKQLHCKDFSVHLSIFIDKYSQECVSPTDQTATFPRGVHEESPYLL